MSRVFFLGLVCLFPFGQARRRAEEVESYLSGQPFYTGEEGVRLINLVVDAGFDLPTNHMNIVYEGPYEDEDFITTLCTSLQYFGIRTSLYELSRHNVSSEYLDQLVKDLKSTSAAYMDGAYIFMTSIETSEDVISTIRLEKLGRRNIIYIFLMINQWISDEFQSDVEEVMRVSVITRPRPKSYQVYYNQASPVGGSEFQMVNWWTSERGFFRKPLFPQPSDVFRNLQGRSFVIPVLHKPPWYFVTYNNDCIQVEGGRDEKLLTIISQKLNFRFEYFDPPDRSEGTAMVNNTMQGVLGLIWTGEVDIFIGDLTVTFERSLAVEFSFFTLSDSEVFLTHAPGKLNEALALIRPFHWQVWPAIIGLVALSGPTLFILRKRSLKWDSSSFRQLCDCIWITTTIFLRQSLVAKIRGDRARFCVILLYLAATYVIGDMYSANLTSLFTRPAREKPISTLEQLNDAMTERNFKLLVVRHSASHGVFENGTGVYSSIWNKMKTQSHHLLDSIEEGIELVKKRRDVAVIGGRETFYYNAKRYGVQHFHLSQRLYTRYSAIALQIGCPFIEHFNKLIINMFESGILSKITEDEYQKLREKKMLTKISAGLAGGSSLAKSGLEATKDVGEGKTQGDDDDERLKPMSMKTLQGAFYVLIVGCFAAGIIFLAEMATEWLK